MKNKIDWESLDHKSRSLAKNLLEQQGYTVQETHGNCYLDIIFEKNGQKYGLEIKDRNFAHDKYGDIFCEQIKQQCAMRDLSKGLYKAVLVCNFFTDRVVAFSNILAGHQQQLFCPRTTMLNDHNYIPKLCWKCPQQKKYSYTIDNGNIQWKKV